MDAGEGQGNTLASSVEHRDRTRLTTRRACAQIHKGCCGASLAYQAWYGGPFVRFGSRDVCLRYRAKPVHQVSIPLELIPFLYKTTFAACLTLDRPIHGSGWMALTQ